MSFTLHPRLEAGTHLLGTTKGCQILLKKNSAFPWILIVPEVSAEIEDLHQLPPEQFAEVAFLIREVSQFVEETFQPDKLNVACIGNIVRQLHIHVVGRTANDLAWPGTVWASDAKSDDTPETIAAITKAAELTFRFPKPPV
jgi:diadenosine tetraphosphate (Ap4A) HIT family hydrolase